MRTCLSRFNTFLTPRLLRVLALVVLTSTWTGCETTSAGAKPDPKVTKPAKEKKEASLFRMHLESNENAGLSTTRIKVLRSAPVEIIIQKEAFIDERDIQQARVISSSEGGFMIAIQMNTHGQLVLQMESTANRSRRIAVWATWTVARWLAAPQITRTTEDGIFMFTPDCSREEADRIVRGLNNVAINLKNQAKPGKQKKVEEDDDAMKRFKTYK